MASDFLARPPCTTRLITRATPLGFRVINAGMDRFRSLTIAALTAGTAAGLILFVVQHLTIVPLIDVAEELEQAFLHAPGHMDHAHRLEDEGWQPAPGLQRIGLTAITTVLSSISFAAILLAAMAMSDRGLNLRRGALWGLAGFTCFVLAPALSLPPQPPGAALGDLYARQMWWIGTVAATAGGIWLIFGTARTSPARTWSLWAAGVALLILPQLLAVPASLEADPIPAALKREFAALSVATNLLFWIVLGALCGFAHGRETGHHELEPTGHQVR